MGFQKNEVVEQIKKESEGEIKNLDFRSFSIKQSFQNKSGLTILLIIIITLTFPLPTLAQQEDWGPSSSKLKKLSLEELMNIEVTSVSLRPEKLTEVASAVQVVRGEDIHRSGVLRLPEALRLSPNLQVAQANSHDWSVAARGFSGIPRAGGLLSNKLLVMMDGRSLYSPLFGGVYWDVQNVMLEDIDRIEVVSGPGGTLWGANAVNGVINIVRKSAKETQGIYVGGVEGSFLQDRAEVRYGGRVDSNLFFRVYGQHFDQKGSNDVDSINPFNVSQGGFRMDYYPTKKNTFTLQGDFYEGSEKVGTQHANTSGNNVLGRFTRNFSRNSDLKVQIYVDRTERKTPNAARPLNYEVNTYDLDIQYRLPVGSRQSVLAGTGYRFMEDITNTPFLDPKNRQMPLLTGFIQDEITCIPSLLKLTVGSKIQHNVFTGIEVQPSARIAFTPTNHHTVWAAVSRAVRTPGRFDSDIINLQGAKLTPVKFKSEKLIAYELGYRLRPAENVSLSIATYYNEYEDLRSINSSSIPSVPVIISNDQKATSWGCEISGIYQATEKWRLRGGYTYLEKSVSPTQSSVLAASGNFEGVDPQNQFMLQSIMDLRWNFSLDVVGRYVDELRSITPSASIPAYYTGDVRIAWNYKYFEFSIVGQNLLQKEHLENGISAIPRSVYTKLIFQF